MRAVLTIVAAVGLAVLTANSFMHQNWLSGTAFLAGLLVLLLPLLFGQGLGHLEDADLLMRFVKSPFGTIVDETLDRVSQQDDQPARTRPSESPTEPGDIEYPRSEQFDPDAVIQRYLASKQAAAADGATPAAMAGDPAPIRTFGRKQV